MSQNTPESVSLFYTEGSSDKEYRVELREVGPDEWMTLAFNGRRGSTLKEQKKTPTPVDYATAKKLYDKVVLTKTKDGYTPDQSGAVYQSTDMAERFSGFVPQLLNSLRKPADLQALIHDPDVIAQEKHDGERRPIRHTSGKTDGLNKEGVIVSLPMNVVAEIEALGRQLLMDGEIMGERYVAFDLLELDGHDLRARPYTDRLELLTGLLDGAPLQQVELVVTATTPAEKQKLFDDLKAHKAEGLVLKKKSAAYAPGRPASGGSQMKWKFIETCSIRVTTTHKTKRSVSLECLANDGITPVPLGNVTIPSNFDIPTPGAIVNVEYLYLYDGGSLFQPVYKGVRTDQAQPDQLHQFKLKSTTAFVANADTPAPAKRKAPKP